MKEFDPRTSDMSGDMSKSADGTHAVSRTANGKRAVSARPAEATVVVVEQKRKRYTAQQKLELVRLTYLPGNTVSSVARSYDIAPALLPQLWLQTHHCGHQSRIAKFGSGTCQYQKSLSVVERARLVAKNQIHFVAGTKSGSQRPSRCFEI